MALQSARPPVEGVWTTIDTPAAGLLRVYARRCGTSGSGRPFVLVHGLGVSGRYMVPLLERLARSGVGWAPDLPGFGRSPGPPLVFGIGELAEALGAWIDEVGIAAPVLVGNSMGCQIVAHLAASRPARIAAVVLIAPTMDRSAGGRWQQIARWLATGLREPLSMIWLAIRDYLRAGFRRTWRTFVLAQESRTARLYPGVTCPALVMRGARDLVVTQAWVERVARLLPRGQVEVVAGAAHAAHYDCPDEVAGRLEAFARRGER